MWSCLAVSIFTEVSVHGNSADGRRIAASDLSCVLRVRIPIEALKIIVNNILRLARVDISRMSYPSAQNQLIKHEDIVRQPCAEQAAESSLFRTEVQLPQDQPSYPLKIQSRESFG